MNHSQHILEAIRIMPDLTSQEVADLVPDVPRKSVSPLISQLVRKGKLVITGSKPNPNAGTSRRGPYAKLSTYAVATGRSQPKPKPKPLPIKEDLLAQMQAEIDALKAFQQQAIERHPDLAVPPSVLAARQLVAELIEDKEQAKTVLEGKKDSCLPVRVALAAWEQGGPS